MKTINVEPNWKGLYRWMMQVKKTDRKVYDGWLSHEEGGAEFHKILEMAKMNGWDKEGAK